MSTVVNLDSLGSDGFLIQGDASGDIAGFSVSDAGDFNGDGYDDVIVGAPFNDSGGTSSGAAYIIFGGADGFGPVDLGNLQAGDGVRFVGGFGGDYAGLTVSSAGDFNGDGFDDVLIGAPQSGYGAFSITYVVFGEASSGASIDLSDLSSSDGIVMLGDYTNAYYASLSVSNAGDVNGDGFDDVIIGSMYDNYTPGPFYGSSAGAAYVVFGRANSGIEVIDLTIMSSSTGFEISGAPESYAGRSVSDAGDVNGDGFDDIIVGVPYGGDEGQAYVIFGKADGFGKIDLANLSASAGFLIHGAESGDTAGFSVSAAGDINGDGYGDIIIGAPNATNNHDVAGEAYVIFGKASGFGTIDLGNLAPGAGFAIFGDDSADHAGWSVSAAGDVNNDGFDNFLIGAPFSDNVRSGVRTNDAGEAYLIYGRAGGFSTIDLTNLAPADGFVISGEAAGDWAGFSVSGAGDVNGDGSDDLIIGAPDNDRGGGSAGAAYVLFSDPAPDVRNDLNGDGRSDILWRSDSGQLTNWLGQANGSFVDNSQNGSVFVSNDWQIYGVGDFNGDGRDDILWRSNTGQMTNWLSTGNGGYSNNSANAFAQVSTDWAIADVGDFNGDGRDDIVWRNESGQMTNWLATASGGFTDNSANASVSISTAWHIAGTGDFNGDGRDDILWRNDDGSQTNWLGQANGSHANNPNASTFVATSWSIAGTGDFNGDGRDGILWRNDNGDMTNWLGQANGGFVNNPNASTFVPVSWQISGTGDFNGDGRYDILWRNEVTGDFTTWLGQSNGGFANNPPAATGVPTTWHIVETTDSLF